MRFTLIITAIFFSLILHSQNEFQLEKQYFSTGNIEKFGSGFIMYGKHGNSLELFQLDKNFNLLDQKQLCDFEDSKFAFAHKGFNNQISFSFHGPTRGYILLDSNLNVLETETWTRKSENKFLSAEKKYKDPNYLFEVYNMDFPNTYYKDQKIEFIKSNKGVSIGFYSKQKPFTYETWIKEKDRTIFDGDYQSVKMYEQEAETLIFAIKKSATQESIYTYNKSSQKVEIQFDLNSGEETFEAISKAYYDVKGNIIILGNIMFNSLKKSSNGCFIKTINKKGELISNVIIPIIEIPSVTKDKHKNYLYAFQYANSLNEKEHEYVIEVIRREGTGSIYNSNNEISGTSTSFVTKGYAYFKIDGEKIENELIYELDSKSKKSNSPTSGSSRDKQILGDNKTFCHFDAKNLNLVFKTNVGIMDKDVYAIYSYGTDNIRILDEISKREDNGKFILLNNGNYIYYEANSLSEGTTLIKK